MEDKTVTGADLKVWRTTVLQMTQVGLADALGLQVDWVRRVEKAADKPVDIRTRLACASLSLGLTDYDLGSKIGLELGRVASPGLRR